MSFLASALIVVLGDQVLKYAVFNFVESPTMVTGFLRLAHVTNRGVAFGIGKNMETSALGKYFFVFLSIGVVVALLGLFGRYCKNRRWARISLGLIVGGAFSNLIDRLMLGHVRDFIDFTFWWTFNVADLAICVGVTVLIGGILLGQKGKKPISEVCQPQSSVPSAKGE